MTLGMNMDEVVFVPVASAMRIFNQSSLFRILIEAGAHADIEDVRRDVLKTLITRHDGEEDVTILTQDSMLASFNRILGALTLSLAGIAAVSLSVAGIGIMNVMLVSVSERTREIGLRRAVGARKRDVMLQFLVEAVALSCCGGLAGIVFGFAAAVVVTRVLEWPASVSPGAVALAFGIAAAVGVFFGFYPARRASRLDPIDALRYE
jgi:putative ABC transport system permease protein